MPDFMGSRKRLLIFRTGNLGDTIIAIPALSLIREHYCDFHITMMCNGGIGSQITARDVLAGSGLVDDFLMYPSLQGRGFVARLVAMVGVMLRVRLGHFDDVIYLPESRRDANQIARDRRLFRLFGHRQAKGLDEQRPHTPTRQSRPLPTLDREMERMVHAIAHMGVPIKPLEVCRHSLGLSGAERSVAKRFLDRVPRGRCPIGVAIGSKMPSKCWPLERYAKVLRHLRESKGVYPIFLGGNEDSDPSSELIAQIGGEGLNLCGLLGIRESAAVLAGCRIYLGNDTGPMHLAASEGTPCVAVFSARDYPGSWFPVGSNHEVIRKSIDCEGCMLQHCVDRRNECLTEISAHEVIAACDRLWASTSSLRS
jgi:heptosyltransferase III